MGGGKMRVVYKYATGQPIPPGAKYLSTQVETTQFKNSREEIFTENTLVWHYYETQIEEKKDAGNSKDN